MDAMPVMELSSQSLRRRAVAQGKNQGIQAAVERAEVTEAFKSIKWDGKQVTKPGLYSNVGIELYHSDKICAGPSVSSSGLRKIFNESPAHFYSQWAGNPKRIEPKETRAFAVGRAVHHLLLGQPFFAQLCAIQPDEWPDENGVLKPWHNARNVCKAWHEQKRKDGRTVLTAAEVESIKGMAASLGLHPIVRAGALNGQVERSIFWKDKATGIWLKSRPDSIPGDSLDFCDIKTCQSVRWKDLQQSIADFGYHQQASLVRTAAREIMGADNITFTLIFVEKENPWCVRIVTLKDNDLDRGEKQNRAALETFAQCLKSKHWPGPGGDREDTEHIELPEWAQKHIDDRLTHGIF